MATPSDPSVGAVVFWHDPDDGACSGLRRVAADRGDVLVLTDLAGDGVTEAFPGECTPVADCDVVGADEAGRWEFWDAARQATYLSPEAQAEGRLTEEEARRVEAVRRQLAAE